MADAKLDSALDMMRRMPPSAIENNLYDLIDVAPDITDDLLSSVDQPLKTCKDPETGKEFLLCDYNRDGDFHRSPWSNKYYDPEDPAAAIEDDSLAIPGDDLRKYEQAANEMFDLYRERYYSGPPAPKLSLSSVYFWEPEDASTNMAACILFHSEAETDGITGTWDSIHIAEVTERSPTAAFYKLTTTIILQCETTAEGVKNDVGGYRMQVLEKEMANDASSTHLVNMGTLVQEMENRMLSQMKEIYFGKTQETTNKLRYIDGGSSRQAGMQLRNAFMEAAGSR